MRLARREAAGRIRAVNSGWGGMTERSGEQPRVLDAVPPPVERLVNLTEHAITVNVQETSPSAEGSAPAPATATFAPDGRVARVLDDQALPVLQG